MNKNKKTNIDWDDPDHWLKAQYLTKRVMKDFKKNFDFNKIKELKEDEKNPFYSFFEPVVKMGNHIDISFFKVKHKDYRTDIDFHGIPSLLSADISLYIEDDRLTDEESFYKKLTHNVIHATTYAYQGIDSVFDDSCYEEERDIKNSVDLYYFFTTIPQIDAEMSSYCYEHGSMPKATNNPWRPELTDYFKKTYRLPWNTAHAVACFITRLFQEKLAYKEAKDIRDRIAYQLSDGLLS